MWIMKTGWRMNLQVYNKLKMEDEACSDVEVGDAAGSQRGRCWQNLLGGGLDLVVFMVRRGFKTLAEVQVSDSAAEVPHRVLWAELQGAGFVDEIDFRSLQMKEVEVKDVVKSTR